MERYGALADEGSEEDADGPETMGRRGPCLLQAHFIAPRPSAPKPG
jgi:hypothetical protein